MSCPKCDSDMMKFDRENGVTIRYCEDCGKIIGTQNETEADENTAEVSNP